MIACHHHYAYFTNGGTEGHHKPFGPLLKYLLPHDSVIFGLKQIQVNDKINGDIFLHTQLSQ